jgi:hypothetical protein
MTSPITTIPLPIPPKMETSHLNQIPDLISDILSARDCLARLEENIQSLQITSDQHQQNLILQFSDWWARERVLADSLYTELVHFVISGEPGPSLQDVVCSYAAARKAERVALGEDSD